MITMNDKQKAELERVERALADRGIFPMYGGSKGHGFWLNPMEPKLANTLLDHFDPKVWHDNAGPTIENDGHESGNPYFLMFSEARKLADGKIPFPPIAQPVKIVGV